VVVDGELVCLQPATGRPSLERLMASVQARLPAVAARQAPAMFMAFDVLVVDGFDVCGRPYVERR
jgi:ATP-dependent DNA ligase